MQTNVSAIAGLIGFMAALFWLERYHGAQSGPIMAMGLCCSLAYVFGAAGMSRAGVTTLLLAGSANLSDYAVPVDAIAWHVAWSALKLALAAAATIFIGGHLYERNRAEEADRAAPR